MTKEEYFKNSWCLNKQCAESLLRTALEEKPDFFKRRFAIWLKGIKENSWEDVLAQDEQTQMLIFIDHMAQIGCYTHLMEVLEDMPYMGWGKYMTDEEKGGEK